MPDEEGRRQEGALRKQGLFLDLGYPSPHLHHQPRKLICTDTFPFRMVPSRPPTIAHAAASNARAGSPPSPHLLASLPNLSTVTGGAGTARFGHSVISDSSGMPWSQQPFAAPFKVPGMAGDATLQLCSPFTAAQWQELHRQALILKYFMASTAVPSELLSTPGAFPGNHSLLTNCLVSRGGDYLNLRFTGSNGDMEPGRCRRTDGKKWRCSKDVAPGQKYCERHMHRPRPRSRKPVEHDRRAGPAAADGPAAVLTTSAGTSHASATTTAIRSCAVERPRTESSPGSLPTADLTFPFQFVVPRDKINPRCLGSGRVDAEAAQAATQQWQLVHSRSDARNATSVSQRQQHEHRLNLSCTSLKEQHGRPLLCTGISSLNDAREPDKSDTPPEFIDAVSRSENLFGVTIIDKDHQHRINNCIRSCVPPPGNLSPSNLTLSMSGSCWGGSDDRDRFQTGLGAGDDSVKMQGPSWGNPVVSPVGGPLAEALQSRSRVSSFDNERTGGESTVTTACAGPVDLMSKTSCGSEGASPRDSTVRRFSSPTPVLHKAPVSLSDSSGSPKFGLGTEPELALLWRVGPSN